jgi:hypothetical protein
VRHLLAGASIALAAILLCAGCKPADEPVSVPPMLQGIWMTADARYAGRTFEIADDRITLTLGEEQRETYPIRKFTKRVDTTGSIYEVTYAITAENSTDTLVFRYESREGGVVRLKNQPHLEWRRERPTA